MLVDSRSVDTKIVGERFFLTTFLVLLKVSDGWTLPDYLPTVRNINSNHERNYLIEQYFHLGPNYLRHGVRSSLRQLKRILRSRGLRRKKIHSRIDRVVNAVDQELHSSESCIGYRQMHQPLLSDHRIVTDRDTVRRIVKSL